MQEGGHKSCRNVVANAILNMRSHNFHAFKYKLSAGIKSAHARIHAILCAPSLTENVQHAHCKHTAPTLARIRQKKMEWQKQWKYNKMHGASDKERKVQNSVQNYGRQCVYEMRIPKTKWNEMQTKMMVIFYFIR